MKHDRRPLRRRSLCGGVGATALLLSLAVACGGSATAPGAPGPHESSSSAPDASLTAARSGGTTGATTSTRGAASSLGGGNASGDAGGPLESSSRESAASMSDLGPPQPDGGKAAIGPDAGCIPHDNACSDESVGGAKCCGGIPCTHGVCGSCRLEGVACSYDGGAPPDGGSPCCNGLVCNDGFCGTGLCKPDGDTCTKPGDVCCNDDCNNGTCGG